MKNVRLNVAKSLFVIALASPFAYADGDQGSGGFASGGGVTACEASIEGDQGSGGLTNGPCEEPSYLDSIMKSIYGYFDAN